MAGVLLASSSPRRRELLSQLGVALTTASPDVDETERPGEEPMAYVRRLAVAKARTVGADSDTLVIAADTTVDVDGQILSKPVDVADARRMLRLLAGRDHLVHTGVALRRNEHERVAVVSTVVTFAALTEATIGWYISHESVLDKAGAYAVQGAAGAFVERVHGSITNVIGLPLAEVAAMAASLGVALIPG